MQIPRLKYSLICIHFRSSSSPQDVYADDHSEDCVVCLTHERDTILLPCRHFCVCGHCMEMITKCPICRTPLMSFLKWKDEELSHKEEKEEEEEGTVVVEIESTMEKRS